MQVTPTFLQQYAVSFFLPQGLLQRNSPLVLCQKSSLFSSYLQTVCFALSTNVENIRDLFPTNDHVYWKNDVSACSAPLIHLTIFTAYKTPEERLCRETRPEETHLQIFFVVLTCHYLQFFNRQFTITSYFIRSITFKSHILIHI